MSVPAVDVVILTWNDGPLLSAAVASALSSVDVRMNVIVFDNGSEPPAVVPADPRVLLVRSDENLGVAAGRNAGARHGTSPVVCFLDSDAVLEANTLHRLVNELDRSRGVQMAVPLFSGQSPQASAGRTAGVLRKSLRALGITSLYGKARLPEIEEGLWEVEFGIGACQVVCRSVFEQLGGFDESFFYGPEDVEFCQRLRRAGGRIVQVGTASCHHPPRRRHRSIFRRGGIRHAMVILRYFARNPRL